MPKTAHASDTKLIFWFLQGSFKFFWTFLPFSISFLEILLVFFSYFLQSIRKFRVFKFPSNFPNIYLSPWKFLQLIRTFYRNFHWCSYVFTNLLWDVRFTMQSGVAALVFSFSHMERKRLKDCDTLPFLAKYLVTTYFFGLPKVKRKIEKQFLLRSVEKWSLYSSRCIKLSDELSFKKCGPFRL